jgi:isocitrate dehydrogenase
MNRREIKTMTKNNVMKMSKNELKDFIIEVRTRVEMGIASENLVKLGIVALKRLEE